MKTIKKTFEPIPDEQYENPFEVRDSPLGGVIACIAIAFLTVVGIISLVAASVYIAEWVVKFF